MPGPDFLELEKTDKKGSNPWEGKVRMGKGGNLATGNEGEGKARFDEENSKATKDAREARRYWKGQIDRV